MLSHQSWDKYVPRARKGKNIKVLLERRGMFQDFPHRESGGQENKEKEHTHQKSKTGKMQRGNIQS